MENPNLAKELFSLVVKASKAQRKPDYPGGIINYSWNLSEKTITGNFILPLKEFVNEETGELKHEIADFLF